MNRLGLNGALGWDEDTMHIWLQMRLVFTLGLNHKYPKEMMRHHYSDIPLKYFIMVEGESASESGYSDDFSKNRPTSSEYTNTFHGTTAGRATSGGAGGKANFHMQLELDDKNPNIFEKSPPKSTIGDKTLSQDDDGGQDKNAALNLMTFANAQTKEKDITKPVKSIRNLKGRFYSRGSVKGNEE